MLNVFLLASAHADTRVFLRDGKVIMAKALRRQGDTIMATQELPAPTPAPGQAPAAPMTGELGYPIGNLLRIEFAKPGALVSAADQLAAGKNAEALALVDSAIGYFEGFRDAPGSWWADLGLLKVQALFALKRDDEATAYAGKLSSLSSDPEVKRGAQAVIGASQSRKGDHAAAVATLGEVLKSVQRQDIGAIAAFYKGQSHLALKQWDEAILSYLQVPVLFPEARPLQTAAQLGAGRCYAALEDFARAKETFQSIIKSQPNSAEAIAAKSELEATEKREKTLAPPK